MAAIRAALSLVVYPVQYVVNVPVKLGGAFADNFATRRHLVQENRRLHEEHFYLSSRSQRFAALEQENARLRELLDSTSVLREQVIVADVLAIETTPSSRQVVVNKGLKHGVFVGQPLLDAHGVIGQITHVAPFSSTALLITDPRHALPVQVNRSGVRAIAVGGQVNDELTLSFVPMNADIEVGDLIVTSGLGQRFPSGYPVGRVNEVKLEPGESFARILIDPTAKVGHSREVLLVRPAQSQIEGERVSALGAN